MSANVRRLAALALVLATAPAVLADEVYFTLGAQRGSFDGAAPAGCTLNDSSASGTGASLGVGYRFNDPFAIEFGWQTLGSLDLTATCPGPVTVQVDAPDSGLSVSGVGRLGVGRDWWLLGRVGAYSWSAAADSGTEGVIGIGVEHAFSRNLGLRLEYSAIGSDADAFALTLRFDL